MQLAGPTLLGESIQGTGSRQPMLVRRCHLHPDLSSLLRAAATQRVSGRNKEEEKAGGGGGGGAHNTGAGGQKSPNNQRDTKGCKKEKKRGSMAG